MKNYCDICGRTPERESRYHSACLRRLFGTPSLPVIELTHAEVLARAQEMAGRMSISGVQPKLSMSRQGSRLIPVTDGGLFILKPQTERFPLLPQNENLCMTIAERIGIDVPPHGLFDLRDGSPAYIVRRFDRTPAGQKLRCEDFVQILGEDDKYSGSVERIGKRIRDLSSVPGLDAQLLFERVLLNFLLGNGDAHLWPGLFNDVRGDFAFALVGGDARKGARCGGGETEKIFRIALMSENPRARIRDSSGPTFGKQRAKSPVDKAPRPGSACHHQLSNPEFAL